jgi:hypothetical protein
MEENDSRANPGEGSFPPVEMIAALLFNRTRASSKWRWSLLAGGTCELAAMIPWASNSNSRVYWLKLHSPTPRVLPNSTLKDLLIIMLTLRLSFIPKRSPCQINHLATLWESLLPLWRIISSVQYNNRVSICTLPLLNSSNNRYLLREDSFNITLSIISNSSLWIKQAINQAHSNPN